MVANAAFFSPELLPNNRSVTTSYSVPPLRTSRYITTYYTYNGTQMKSEKLFYDDLNTGYVYIKRGTLTKNVADGIFEIAMNAASVANVYVGFLTAAISLYDSFMNMFGAGWATGATDDFLQVRLIYDNTDQWTYRNINGEWYLGYVSQKAVISNIASEQYYYNSAQRKGQTYSTSRNITKTQKSQYFDSPWAIAYQWANLPYDDYVNWRCGGIIFYF